MPSQSRKIAGLKIVCNRDDTPSRHNNYLCGIMLNAARHTINTHLPSEVTILLAFSGGVDSIVLLQLLLDAGLKPALAHCNFQLRGLESDQDEDFARKTAGDQGLEFFTKRFPTKQYGSENNLSTQMAARELRYQYFSEIMEQNGFSALLTAHHLDDSIETFLINFGRGTGIRGLTGISNHELKVIRPLLNNSKTEILAFAKKKDLAWREDSSNAQTDYQRNQLRHEVIPALKKSIPNAEQGARHSFSNLQEDASALNYFLEEVLKEHLLKKGEHVILPIKNLREKPFWPALIHYWLQPFGNFDWSSIKSIEPGNSGNIYQAELYEVLQDRDKLILRKRNDSSEPTRIEVEKTNTSIHKPVNLHMDFKSRAEVQISEDPNRACLDADKLEFPLTLRLWQPGDVFCPLGMQGSKKLSDFLTDQRLSRFDKEKQWVLCSGTNIAWIVGQRIDDRYKLRNSTKTVYFVRLLKN